MNYTFIFSEIHHACWRGFLFVGRCILLSSGKNNYSSKMMISLFHNRFYQKVRPRHVFVFWHLNTILWEHQLSVLFPSYTYSIHYYFLFELFLHFHLCEMCLRLFLVVDLVCHRFYHLSFWIFTSLYDFCRPTNSNLHSYWCSSYAYHSLRKNSHLFIIGSSEVNGPLF